MAVLPNALGNNEGSARVKLPEYFHPHLLRINEAMLFACIERMRPYNFPTLNLKSLGEDFFHFGLFGPTFLVGRKAQIAIGHQIDMLTFQWSGFFHRWFKLQNEGEFDYETTPES